MNKKVINVINIGKVYRIGERLKYNTVRDSIVRATSNISRILTLQIKKKSGNNNCSTIFKPEEVATGKPGLRSKLYNGNPNYIWSLKNVSFDVSRGEILGIIGRNGAGKSTLLKIISGITEPTEGRIDIYGRIGSLLEVGTGFHPELTGRENIFLNGTILGMRKREIESKLNEIVDFSEIREFIDTPVKYYSSGMRVRLGFSVAAHLESDILLLDEILAVGDASFQQKCYKKIRNLTTSGGKTILFISHDLGSVRSLCERTILLEEGEIIAVGSTEKVVDQYLKSISLTNELPLSERIDVDKYSESSVIATSLKIENLESGKPIRPTSQIIFKIGYRCETPVRNFTVNLRIRDFSTGQPITYFASDNSSGMPEILPPQGTIVCVTNKSYFTPGRCAVDIRFKQGMIDDYTLVNAGSFNVEDEIVFLTRSVSRKLGMFLLDHNWSIENI
jgi:lipopolysaccharide transport system ATP-binding protein